MAHRLLIIALIAAPAAAFGQVYRCDTPQGVVFSDERCGEQAEVVEFEEDSSGVTIDPPDEVSDYLAQKREEREEAREAYRDSLAAAPRPVVYPEPEEPYHYYDYGYRYPIFYPPLHPRPPIQRPPDRPRPPMRAPPSTLDPNR